MARRRHAMNPAKLRADAEALERQETGARSRPRLAMRPRPAVVLLNLLAVTLLSVSFAPFDGWFLAYVALVPWVLALDCGCSRRWEVFWAWMGGLLFWAAGLYWLWWITLVGYAALVVYLSAYWLLAAVVVRAAMRRRLPMWLVLPVVWTALEYARAYVISGFPWFFLAHSQWSRTVLIQVADLTGQYGVSFFVAMVNGAVVDVLASPLLALRPQGRRLTGRAMAAVAAVLVATGGLLGYGWWRLAEYERRTSPGPVVGIVQHAFPISLSGRGATGEKILADHVASTRNLFGAGCDLVLWPETMLPRGLNPDLLDVDPAVLPADELRSLAEHLFGPDARKYDEPILRSAMQRYVHGLVLPGGARQEGLRDDAEEMAELSRKLGCPILAGGATVHRNLAPVGDADRWVTRNSALWFGDDWRASAVYSKTHLVPFSEYVPFKKSWPALHKALRWFVPPVMDQLDPGRIAAPFALAREGKSWRLASPICYEGTFARVCRRMVVSDGAKRVDILANLSNDGWFVYHVGDGPYRGSTEHPQHLAQYCFRAVENRVPVLRAVNTGISASIDSCGRIRSAVEFRFDDYRKRSMVVGTLLLDGGPGEEDARALLHGPQVLVDSRISVYSLAGDVFAMAVSVAALGLAAVLLWRRAPANRPTVAQQPENDSR